MLNAKQLQEPISVINWVHFECIVNWIFKIHFKFSKLYGNKYTKSFSNVFNGAVGSADLKISKSALLSLNHHNFSYT